MPEITAPKMPAPRLIIPGLGGLYGALSLYAEPLLRFVIGVLLVPHGMQKIFYTGVDHLAPSLANLALQLRFSSFEMSAARLSLVSASPE
jgi:hypothetical protein